VGEEIVTREQQSRLVKRRKDTSPRLIIKLSTKLLKG
jgi:hypothetical protein